jgi:hypothetical protein|tara:strand:- start:111 stop:311 length:201 start_codon:yes stop_codon:yes gene_type:complete
MPCKGIDPNMKSFFYDYLLYNGQHIIEMDILVKNPLSEKIQFVLHTFLIPFNLIKSSIRMRIYGFF